MVSTFAVAVGTHHLAFADFILNFIVANVCTDCTSDVIQLVILDVVEIHYIVRIPLVTVCTWYVFRCADYPSCFLALVSIVNIQTFSLSIRTIVIVLIPSFLALTTVRLISRTFAIKIAYWFFCVTSLAYLCHIDLSIPDLNQKLKSEWSRRDLNSLH